MHRLRHRYGHAKASALKAVEAARLYMGSEGLSIKTQQRFHTRMLKAIERAAKDHGMSVHDAHEQIMSKASSMGRLHPRPGKDY